MLYFQKKQHEAMATETEFGNPAQPYAQDKSNAQENYNGPILF